MAGFDLGDVMSTVCISDSTTIPSFRDFMYKSLERYKKQDWGDICEEDKKKNDAAVRNGEQIVALYKYSDDISMYIITDWNYEWHKRVTTLCFPYER